MEVIRGILNIRERHRGCVVTMGNFDGVHTGHQRILAAVRQRADQLGVQTLVICFEPQPKEFFDEFNAPARLTRFREKVELFQRYGVDLVLCLQFNEQTRQMSAARFIEMLVDDLGISSLYVGDDFRFGHDRSGDFDQLLEAGASHGFEVMNLHTIAYERERVSSTRIRDCLNAGDFELAEKLLGHAYSISGKVVYGRQLGRTLGVPTANIHLHRYVTPIAGVYACEIQVAGLAYQGIANVGVRPTVDEAAIKPILEVHLFDFDGDLYGSTARVIFQHKIRDEQKFAGLDDLKAQIHRDIEAARGFFEATT